MENLIDEIQKNIKKIPPFKKVLLAVSGGVDSMALAHLFKQLEYEIIAVHINHQLRGSESERDEQFVIYTMKKWKIPCIVKRIQIPKKGNLESLARQGRYKALEEIRQKYKASYIVVAHHFDDQIETILMHEKRGCGLRGRRGMPLFNQFIFRPLIETSKKAILDYAEENKLEYIVDSSNFDNSFERNHLRQEIIPELKKIPNFENEMRQISKNANIQLKLLQKRKLELKRFGKIQKNYFDRQNFNTLDNDLKSEILIDIVGQNDLYKREIQRFIDFIKFGENGKVIQIKSKYFVLEYNRVTHYEQIPIQNKKVIKLQNQLEWENYLIQSKTDIPTYVRSWKQGDRFQPSGMKGHKKIQDFFVDNKIPKYKRYKIPVIVDEKDAIICIGNMRFSEKYKDFRHQIIIQEK